MTQAACPQARKSNGDYMPPQENGSSFTHPIPCGTAGQQEKLKAQPSILAACPNPSKDALHISNYP